MPINRYNSLPPRKRELIDRMMDGHTTRKSLAESMGISTNTVRQYMHAIFDHYGIDTERFLGAIRLAYLRSKELGLI